MKRNEQRMALWKERLERNQSAYENELEKMDRRERLYRGLSEIKPMTRDDRAKATPHVRNICAELIEAQVSSEIPQPKVTPMRKRDERLAAIIEDMLRNELDRLPFEAMNDMTERTVPMQGGALFSLEWDNTARTHTTVGELCVSVVHPKQMVPQHGVTSGIEDMDYIILKVPQTKEYIRSRYGVDLDREGEEEPEVRGAGEQSHAEDLVTQYMAYWRNEAGGIGLYSWCGETELEDLEDYQARRLRRCKGCGTPKGEGETCESCGGTQFESCPEEYEEIWRDIQRSDGSVIPCMTPVMGAGGMRLEPTKIPYYKPDIYPVVLLRSVSVFGRLLGDSDIDKIESQQNTANRIERKIIDKLIQSGSYLSLPDDAKIRVDSDEMKVVRLGNPADAQMIHVYDLEGNISQDMAYLQQVYEEARQIIGVTDSFQGRKDTTATSGKAKEFAAAQTAGRMESKRVMKRAAYAQLFEAMFKFKLAYADEPRPVVAKDAQGGAVYEQFNRYDFLEQDENGEWYWNDRFLFSCDSTAPLAGNREAMWQETRMNLQTGAFGNPQDITTLIAFWSKMEMLHYPGAGETKAFLEQQLQRQQEAMQAQQMQQMEMQQQQMREQQMEARMGQARAAQGAL